MSIFSKVTRKTLIKNKTRTIVTIIGIILSSAMITAVTSSISSFEKYLSNVMVKTEGYWHGAFYYMPKEDIERLESDEAFDSAAYAQILGYAGDAEDAKDGQAPYLYVLGGDQAFFERMPLKLTEGRLPENPGELVITAQAVNSSVFDGQMPELNDTVTLELGQRYQDGVLVGRTTDFVRGEVLRVEESRTYTIVGVCQREGFDSYANPGFMCLTYMDEQADTPYYECYFLLKDPEDIFDFQMEFSGGEYVSEDNTDYLMTLGVVRYDNFYKVLYSLGAILIGLIMFGSVSLIYNAFSISVAERTKQFGLLRSVGATKKQIRRMVLYEAAAVSVIGIPLGILSGILGMTVTFKFIGRDLSRLFYSDIGVKLHMFVSPAAVISATLIGSVTVLISAWIPSRRAMRVSAIEAIRQSGDVSVKRREVKTSRLTYRLFGLEGVIAGKHFKRSRKRYRATVMSLFMSVVLFIAASSFCRYMMDSVSGVYNTTEYDISYVFHGTAAAESGKTLTEAAAILKNEPHVTRFSAIDRFSAESVEFPRYQLTGKALEFMESDQRYDGLDGWLAKVHVFGVGQDEWLRYLDENGLDTDEYTGEDASAVVYSGMRLFSSQRIVDLTLLNTDVDSIDLRIPDNDKLDELYAREDREELSEDEWMRLYDECINTTVLKVGHHSDTLPFGLDGQSFSGILVLLPIEAFDKLTDMYDIISYPYIYFKTDDHAAAAKGLEKLAADSGLPGEGYFFDVYAATETERSLVRVIEVLSYGFITLISLIAAANVFNTISTNILLRRREFAMLRSVGMTNRGFNKMMNYECLLYGTKALIFGIPAAFALTYLMFRSVNQGMDVDFYLPWSAVAIAVGSVFLVVFATMMYAMSGIRRDNPIEAMKNEVI